MSNNSLKNASEIDEYFHKDEIKYEENKDEGK